MLSGHLEHRGKQAHKRQRSPAGIVKALPLTAKKLEVTLYGDAKNRKTQSHRRKLKNLPQVAELSCSASLSDCARRNLPNMPFQGGITIVTLP